MAEGRTITALFRRAARIRRHVRFAPFRSVPGKSAKGALYLLCAVQLMILLDTSIVHIALPSIQEDVGAPVRDLQWVVSAYALTFGGFLLLGGRMGDLFGRRRMLLIGTLLFTAASTAAGLATGAGVLIAARAAQGLGAAMIAPSVLALLTAVFPEGEQRNRALGVLGAVSAGGFVAGLILGGLLTASVGWRWIFLINLPVGIAAIFLTPKMLQESGRLRQPLDIPGAVTVTAGLALLVYACSLAGNSGLAGAATRMIALALAVLLAFLIIESRVEYPLIPLRTFRNRTLSGALAAAGVFGSTMGPALFLLTLYLQQGLGLDPLTAGLAFLPQEFVVVAVSPLVGKIISRFGAKTVLAGGMLGFGAGALSLTAISSEGGYWQVLPGLLLIGSGAACVLVAGAVAAVQDASPQERGLASGLWNTAPQLGSAVGLALLLSVADAGSDGAFRQHDGTSTLVDAAWMSGFRAAFFAAAGFAAAGLWIVLVRMRKPGVARGSGLAEPQRAPRNPNGDNAGSE